MRDLSRAIHVTRDAKLAYTSYRSFIWCFKSIRKTLSGYDRLNTCHLVTIVILPLTIFCLLIYGC